MTLGADITATGRHVGTAEPESRTSNLRIAFLTNVIAPYWRFIFDSLSPRYRKMRILLSTRMEANRAWEVDWRDLDVVLQKTITVNRRWHHPKGFSEPIYIHLPLDTFTQLRRFRPDVVISNEMGFRTFMALLYRKLRPSSRLLIWAEIAESTEQGRGGLRLRLRRFLQTQVDGSVVLGESGVRYLRALGASDQKIFRVPYTTDVSRFAKYPLTRQEERAHRLLYVGQLIERKGLLPFLNVLSKWAEANPERKIEFLLAGDGPLREPLQRRPVPSNIRVTFSGNLPYSDLPKVYAESGIFVFPTLADTWGVVVNEALASGLPVLGSVYSQAVEELVEERRTGWLFRADVEQELASAINRSLNTPPEALNQMRECARARAMALTPERVADLIDDIVRRVAREAGG